MIAACLSTEILDLFAVRLRYVFRNVLLQCVRWALNVDDVCMKFMLAAG